MINDKRKTAPFVAADEDETGIRRVEKRHKYIEK
jgi:hypothetical protein